MLNLNLEDMGKEKFTMEFVLNSCSHSVLWKAISVPSELSNWFADDVRLKGEDAKMLWEEQVRMLGHYLGIRI